jgi:hypothetical protein
MYRDYRKDPRCGHQPYPAAKEAEAFHYAILQCELLLGDSSGQEDF